MSRRPIEKIARAFRRGTGVRLSADEIRELVIMDDAIEQIVTEINEEYEDDE